MGRVTFQFDQVGTPQIDLYDQTFGHFPSPEAFKFLPLEEVSRLAQEAVESGTPVPEWESRQQEETGSNLDGFVQVSSSEGLS